VLALDNEGRVLLVRHSYGTGRWMPPGGAIRRGESALAAARREMREETGCTLQGAVEIALVEEKVHGAANGVHIVAGRSSDRPVPDRREVLEARFFSLDALPEQLSDGLRRRLPEWVREFAR
jgi:8-oxo-dGTP pyrophosphatase MutT (NUDIX family)